MYKMKITSKGQLTVPKKLREKLGINEGDYLLIRESAGEYIVEKVVDENRFDRYIGLLNRAGSSNLIVTELRGE